MPILPICDLSLLVNLIGRGFTVDRKMSVVRRVVYIVFGIAGIVAMVKTGFWWGSVIPTIFHSTVLIASANWGLVGITGKGIVEWIEIALKQTWLV